MLTAPFHLFRTGPFFRFTYHVAVWRCLIEVKLGHARARAHFVQLVRKRALVRGKDLAPIICHAALGERAILREGTGEVTITKIGPDRHVSIATLRHLRPASCHTPCIPGCFHAVRAATFSVEGLQPN